MQKLISWNVNGLRSCLSKGFLDFFKTENADIFCLQETKMLKGQAEIDLAGYYEFWNSAEKRGYSGTAVFSKTKPLEVFYEIPDVVSNSEGRVITLEYDAYYLLCVYTPNSRRELERLGYRCEWEDVLREYAASLQKHKPVMICGDLNVAHKEIDLKNPASNHKNAGFTNEEREKMTRLLESGFVDSFRHLYPTTADAYTWWSYMFGARAKNVGWRIDYFLVSNSLAAQIEDAKIYANVLGSDHCPVGLILQ
jgi:exodeoxyribonuclease-3